MINKLLSGALCASLVLAGGSAIAQGSGVVAQRQAAMKDIGNSMRDARGLSRDFDAATARRVMGKVAADAKAFGGMFPASSNGASGSEALPAVWSNKADFDRKVRELESLANAAAGAGNAAEFRTAFAKVGATCKACHDDYRAAP